MEKAHAQQHSPSVAKNKYINKQSFFLKKRSLCSKPGKKGGCLGSGGAVEELGSVAFQVLLERFPDGLDEEWERKQAIKNVSSIYLFIF